MSRRPREGVGWKFKSQPQLCQIGGFKSLVGTPYLLPLVGFVTPHGEGKCMSRPVNHNLAIAVKLVARVRHHVFDLLGVFVVSKPSSLGLLSG